MQPTAFMQSAARMHAAGGSLANYFVLYLFRILIVGVYVQAISHRAYHRYGGSVYTLMNLTLGLSMKSPTVYIPQSPPYIVIVLGHACIWYSTV